LKPQIPPFQPRPKGFSGKFDVSPQQKTFSQLEKTWATRPARDGNPFPSALKPLPEDSGGPAIQQGPRHPRINIQCPIQRSNGWNCMATARGFLMGPGAGGGHRQEFGDHPLWLLGPSERTGTKGNVARNFRHGSKPAGYRKHCVLMVHADVPPADPAASDRYPGAYAGAWFWQRSRARERRLPSSAWRRFAAVPVIAHRDREGGFRGRPSAIRCADAPVDVLSNSVYTVASPEACGLANFVRWPPKRRQAAAH